MRSSGKLLHEVDRRLQIDTAAAAVPPRLATRSRVDESSEAGPSCTTELLAEDDAHLNLGPGARRAFDRGNSVYRNLRHDTGPSPLLAAEIVPLFDALLTSGVLGDGQVSRKDVGCQEVPENSVLFPSSNPNHRALKALLEAARKTPPLRHGVRGTLLVIPNPKQEFFIGDPKVRISDNLQTWSEPLKIQDINHFCFARICQCRRLSIESTLWRLRMR